MSNLPREVPPTAGGIERHHGLAGAPLPASERAGWPRNEEVNLLLGIDRAASRLGLLFAVWGVSVTQRLLATVMIAAIHASVAVITIIASSRRTNGGSNEVDRDGHTCSQLGNLR